MRTIRITISANGDSPKHAIKLELKPMEGERALLVFKRLCEAVMQIVNQK